LNGAVLRGELGIKRTLTDPDLLHPQALGPHADKEQCAPWRPYAT